MSETEQAVLHKQLIELLEGRSAHLDAQAVFGGVQSAHWGASVQGAPHTLWELLEHTRIAWEDLLRFSTDPKYKAMEWPKEYWPSDAAPADAGAPKKSLDALKKIQQDFINLVQNEKVDLFAKIPWGDGQTVLREVLLAADHTSYHVGQAMFLRKQLEAS